MKHIDTMKQALEALESVLCGPDGGCCIEGTPEDQLVVDGALAALRLAIAEAEGRATEQAERQEPVAWVCNHYEAGVKNDVDYQQDDIDALPDGTQLYAAPPQRQPLTDDEAWETFEQARAGSSKPVGILRGIRAIERAHGIGGEA